MGLPLTRRQKQILDFLELSIQKNGYAPSLEEIKKHFKLKAISTVHEHVENLKHKGFLKKEMNQARGVEICKTTTKLITRAVELMGKIEKGKTVFQKEPACILHIDFSLVPETKILIAFEVQDSSLSKFGINKGDFIFLGEGPQVKTNSLIVDSLRESSKIYRAKDTRPHAGYVCLIISVRS